MNLKIVFAFLLGVLVFLIISFYNDVSKNVENGNDSFGEFYKSSIDHTKLEIVKVKDCEYVLWHKGRGSDMEHYEGCKNEIHFSNR